MFGKFDQIASVYNATKSINSSGVPVLNYTFAAQFFAAVESVEAAEVVRNDSVITLPRLKITTHYQSQFNTGQRLVYSGTNYNITDIKTVDRRYSELNAIIEEV